MMIKKFEGFVDNHNIDWDMFPDVNVLIGAPGSGKTYMLKIMEKNKSAIIGNPNFCFDRAGFIIETGETPIDNIVYIGGEGLSLKDLNEIASGIENSENMTELDILLRDVMKKDIPDKNIEEKVNGLLKSEFKERYGLPVEQMSTAEKAYAYILRRIAIEGNKNIVVLLDNAENNLTIYMQKELLWCIREINPKTQIITVTQSPFIYSDDYEDNAKGFLEIYKDRKR